MLTSVFCYTTWIVFQYHSIILIHKTLSIVLQEHKNYFFKSPKIFFILNMKFENFANNIINSEVLCFLLWDDRGKTNNSIHLFSMQERDVHESRRIFIFLIPEKEKFVCNFFLMKKFFFYYFSYIFVCASQFSYFNLFQMSFFGWKNCEYSQIHDSIQLFAYRFTLFVRQKFKRNQKFICITFNILWNRRNNIRKQIQ